MRERTGYLTCAVVGVVLFLYAPSLFAFVPQGHTARIPAKLKPKLEAKMKSKGLKFGAPVYLRLFKKTKSLEVWAQHARGDFRLFKSYRICRHSGGLGPKQRAGDMQSPEGFYAVTRDRLNPYSHYHLSMNVGYPNQYDQAFSRTGSGIMIHGNCGSRGCFAMTDQKIEEIYAVVETALENGQSFVPVHIFPFRMTDAEMKKYRHSRWAHFWKNLKEGYDSFEEMRTPPQVTVVRDRYSIYPRLAALKGLAKPSP
jgi:murein L,D-transpeptidase YafK